MLRVAAFLLAGAVWPSSGLEIRQDLGSGEVDNEIPASGELDDSEGDSTMEQVAETIQHIDQCTAEDKRAAANATALLEQMDHGMERAGWTKATATKANIPFCVYRPDLCKTDGKKLGEAGTAKKLKIGLGSGAGCWEKAPVAAKGVLFCPAIGG